MVTFDFSFDDFCDNKKPLPDIFDAVSSTDLFALSTLQSLYEKDGDRIDIALEYLKCRTSKDYFGKIYAAQTAAITYASKVFPTYRYILPEDLADDWLSVVGWHKKYPARDHSLHQPLTAYIVQKILGFGEGALSINIPDGRYGNLLDYCAAQLAEGDKCSYLRSYMADLYPSFSEFSKERKMNWAKDVFYEASVVSALFHDLGYPWQYVHSLSDKVKSAEYDETLKQTRSSEALLSIIEPRLLIYPFYGYSEVSKKRVVSHWRDKVKALIEMIFHNTHGFPGAIAFMSLNDKIRKFPRELSLNDATYRFILDWASVGIMMHDMPNVYYDRSKDRKFADNPFLRLSFERDPLSSLVSMADILEEFQRPKSSFTSSEDDVELKYKFPCCGTEICVDGDTLFVNYKYDTQILADSEKDRRKKEIYEYFNPKDGFIDLSSLGIHQTLCETVKI